MRRAAVVLGLLLGLGGCALFEAPDERYVVFFQEWSAGLDSGAKNVVATASDWAKGHPLMPVHVIGFADPVGTPRANRDLSRTRAQVVADEMVANGVASDRIHVEARGATLYTLDRQESRRVTISLGSP